MKQINRIFVTLILALGLILECAPSLFAQQGGTEEFTLEEITVTAEKREENVQKVAMPIETISGQEIIEMGAVTLRDALANLAGVSVQKMGHELKVVIRGMDDDARPGDSQAMVGVTMDGAYSNMMSVGFSGLYDIERVEVLTGPQGTLYSRNAAGGVVNMISNNPSTEKFDSSVSGEIGNYNHMNVTGMVNIPVTEKVAVRSAFQVTSRDGYVSNGTDDDNLKSMRLKVGYNPSQNLSTIFGFEYSAKRGYGTGGGVDPWETPPDNPWYSSKPTELFAEHRTIFKGYMDLNWNTPIGEIVFLPVYGSSESKDEYEDSTYTDDDGVKWWALGGHQDKMREKSVELRLSSNEGAFMEYIIGLYYYDRFWRKGGETLGYLYGDGKTRQVLGPYNYRDMDNENKAAFANLKFPISNAFRLSAGGRYTADKESDYSYNPVPRNPADPIESWEDYSSSHFDYKLGFEYDLNQDAMLWGDYATGYKAIVMSGQSQTLKSYQIGVKSRIFDQKLQLNATAWYYDYMNFDVDTSKAYYSEGVQYSDRGTGIGDGTLYGLDVSSDYVLTENDLMNLSVAYMFSEISDMLITYQDYYPPDRVLEGMTLNNSPEWSITASYEHRFNLRNGGSLTPKFNILYQTEKTVTFFPEAMFFPGIDVNKANTEPAHHISGASLLYNEPNRKWNLNAYVKNIENHAEKVSMHAVWFRIGEPRTYGIVVSVKF